MPIEFSNMTLILRAKSRRRRPRRCASTVRLGNRKRRMTLRRLVQWSSSQRWRAVVAEGFRAPMRSESDQLDGDGGVLEVSGDQVRKGLLFAAGSGDGDCWLQLPCNSSQFSVEATGLKC
ncbi:uncharacterized protein A4U43_C04F20360 [Asparagus officinalis]|uniref:Uncharacterized protein n=1 Tax=Asparagus officinalis TaxID=4686 RepID=A0A5P1F731_ASPOF|nr:uncharacterized protein A4U43_C04F20360 [Asparagus officinalis]